MSLQRVAWWAVWALAYLPALALAQASSCPGMHVQVLNIRNSTGTVDCALFESPEGFPAVNGHQGVTSDQNIVLRGQNSHAYPDALRRVGYRDPETGKHYVFWTNAFHLAAATIPAIYKARWQIELFFKAIKQNLKIKTFLGTSENAVMTQIWVALITYLLLAFLRFKSGLGLSFQQLLRLLQINLFDRRNLVDLCPPPQYQGPESQQLYAA